MHARLTLAAAAALTLAACATTEAPSHAPAPNAAFRKADFAWSSATGKAEIDGQLVFKKNGTSYGCVDAGVVLTPETPWVRQRMAILYLSSERAALPANDVRGRTPPERSQDYSAFVKRTACDASGHFAFSGLADGPWYVITVARATPQAAGPEMAIMRRVELRGGKLKLTLQ